MIHRLGNSQPLPNNFSSSLTWINRRRPTRTDGTLLLRIHRSIVWMDTPNMRAASTRLTARRCAGSAFFIYARPRSGRRASENRAIYSRNAVRITWETDKSLYSQIETKRFFSSVSNLVVAVNCLCLLPAIFLRGIKSPFLWPEFSLALKSARDV